MYLGVVVNWAVTVSNFAIALLGIETFFGECVCMALADPG